MEPLDLVDKRHIVNLQGRPHPTYPGVLEAAMKVGLRELTVKLLQAPTSENGGLAICEAMAVFTGEDGRDRIHSEIGDCDGSNCNSRIAPHRVRMAATRAKGRALRDALGIGVALAEEMAGDEREDGVARTAANGKPAGAATQPRAVGQNDRPAARLVANQPDEPPRCVVEGCGQEITAAELHSSVQRGWPPHCRAHGYERNMREKAERATAAAAA